MKPPSTTSVVAIGGSIVAFTVWTALVLGGTLEPLDEAVAIPAAEYTSALGQIAAAFALVTWPGVIYALVAVAGWWLRKRRLLHLGLAMWVSIVIGWGGHLLIKTLVRRPRPDGAMEVLTTSGWAYPSGHLTAITVGGCMAVVATIVTRQGRVMRHGMWFAAVGLTVVVGLDRWLMGAHWFSDLVGGFIWGVAASAIALVSCRVHVLPKDYFALGPESRDADEAIAGPPKRCAIVYNPVKVEDLATFRRHVAHELETHGWQAPIWLETTADDPGHAMAQKALELEVDLVMAAGGDGTVRVVCEELADTGVPFAVIPAGTGNLLARNLQIPLDEQSALQVALEGTPTPMDLVEIVIDEEHRYVSGVMAGVGIDAVIMDRTDTDLKRAVGSAAYFVAAAQNVDHPPLPVTITIDDDEPVTREAMLVLVGNVGMLQGGIQIIPDAQADDGYLDLLVASPTSAVDLLRMTRKVLTRVGDEENLEHVRARRVRIEAGRAEQFQLDGDTEGEARVVDATVMPGALTLMKPS